MLMPAGCIDKDYEARLRKLDWERQYSKVPALYRLLARVDKLVVVFTPNQQSLAGLEQLVRRSTEYRQLSKDLRPLLVYPLPSRIDVNGNRCAVFGASETPTRVLKTISRSSNEFSEELTRLAPVTWDVIAIRCKFRTSQRVGDCPHCNDQ
jgi:hypothetical protein